MPGPVLLVLDDIALISVVRRLLSREGREVILASSVADAIIAFGHYRPEVVLLSPRVEDGRGSLVVNELRQHPEGHPLHLVALGEPLAEVDAPWVALPLEEAALRSALAEAERRPVDGGWTVREPLAATATPPRSEPVETPKARGPRGSMAQRLFGDLDGAPSDTPVPTSRNLRAAASSGSGEVTQPGVRSPFFSPEPTEETTQQTVVPEWLRAQAPAGEGGAVVEELARLREELARAQEGHAQARAMVSALRLQSREAEAALRRQADSRHDHSPVEEDGSQALAQLQEELTRAQEDARSARRSLGRAISRQKELEGELERSRTAVLDEAAEAGGDASKRAGAEAISAQHEALLQELASLREAHAAGELERDALRTEVGSLRAELQAGALQSPSADVHASLQRELAALTSARATQEALAEELQRELSESLATSESQRLELEERLAQQSSAAPGGAEAHPAELHAARESLAASEAQRVALEALLARQGVASSIEAQRQASLEAAAGAHEARLSQLEAALEERDLELARWREAAEASQAQLQAALAASEREGRRLEQERLEQDALREELQTALDAERARLGALQGVQAGAVGELRAALELSEASRAAMETRLAGQREQAMELGAARARAEADAAEAAAQLEALRSELTSLREAAQLEGQAQDTAARLSRALEVSEGRAAELESSMQALEERGAEVHQRLAEALAAANARVLDLEAQLEAQRAQGESALAESIQELSTALETSEVARSELESALSEARAALEAERERSVAIADDAGALAQERAHSVQQLELLRSEHARTHAAQLSQLVALEQAQAQLAQLELSHGAQLEAMAEGRASDAAALAQAQELLAALREELEDAEARRSAERLEAQEAAADRERAHEEALAEQAQQHEVAKAQLHEALQTLRAALGEAEATHLSLTAELEQWRDAATRSSDRADATLLAQETEAARLSSELADAHARARAWQEKLAEADAALEERTTALVAEQERRSAAERALVDRDEAVVRESAALSEALATIQRLHAEVAALEATALAEHESLTEQLAAAQAHRLALQDELAQVVAAMQAQRLALQEELATAVAAAHARGLAQEEELAAAVAAGHARRLSLEAELEEARTALAASGEEAGRLRAEQEAILARAVGAVGVVVGETGEGAGGPLDRSRLISLLTGLHLSRPEARLEVRTSDALRVLFFRDGALVGATSTSPGETLLDRARRDGLIDGRQEAELRLLRGVSSGDLLRALRERGYLRENEVLPLVQRHTEQVALEVFSQSDALFRLSLERTPAGLVLAAAVRPPLVLLTEALRAAMPVDGLLSSLGGLGATVRPAGGEIGLGELGLREPELALLRRAETPISVEQLLLGSGMRQEVALRTLALGRAFGLLTIEPGAVDDGDTSEPADDLEVRRLSAKFDEVQDADYFTVLGLPRTAGGAEVRRAFELLSTEFHPLRFAGHPDPELQRRAQAVQELLSEALQALEDDGLRAAYARNLRD